MHGNENNKMKINAEMFATSNIIMS